VPYARYKAHIPCSVTCAATGARSHRTRGAQPASHLNLLFLSTLPMAPMIHPSRDEGALKLALPVGYVRLSGVLLRHQQADPEDHLFVFKSKRQAIWISAYMTSMWISLIANRTMA